MIWGPDASVRGSKGNCFNIGALIIRIGFLEKGSMRATILKGSIRVLEY